MRLEMAGLQCRSQYRHRPNLHHPHHRQRSDLYVFEPTPAIIQLELQPEIEAQLAAEAQTLGLALERYIETIVMARAIAFEPAPDEVQLSRDLQQDLREIAEGNTLPARQVFAQLREEYDI